VDVFFVLSGYLITGLLQAELDQHGRIAFIRFYARRLKRLLPALMVMLLITTGAAIWLLSGAEAGKQLSSGPFAATWTSNIYFAINHFDYFDELSGRDLMLHTWSLGVEEQFYLFWPAVLMVLFRLGNWLAGGKDKRTNFILSGLVILCLASFALSVYWTFHLPQAAYYLMPARLWQLALGGITFLLTQGDTTSVFPRLTGHSNVSAYVTLGMGLGIITVSALGLRGNLAYPGYWALAPALGTTLVLAGGPALDRGRGGPLAHPLLVWLGDRSYSLYLWHWPVLMLGFSLGYQGQVLPTAVLIVISLVFAEFSFRFIEWPFWKGGYSLAPPRQIILLSVLMMAVMIFSQFHSLRHLSRLNMSEDIGEQWRLNMPSIYRLPCDDWYHSARLQPCAVGPNDADHTVVLLGDSIGAQWFSMLPEIFPAPQWHAVVLTKSSCPIIDQDYFYQRIGQLYQVCKDWRNAALDSLDTLRPEVLIIGNSINYDFSKDQWLAGTARILDRVSKSAGKIYIIPGTPSLGFDGPGCVSRHIMDHGRIQNTDCLAVNRSDRVEVVTSFIRAAIKPYANVFMLDLNDLVCPDNSCNAVSKDGIVVFRDSQHLTDTFVRAQVPDIRARMQQHLQN